jgi:hypothetical protein
MLGTGKACSVIDAPERIGPLHIQARQIAIVQKSDFSRRRRDDLANDGKGHAEASQKPRLCRANGGFDYVYGIVRHLHPSHIRPINQY